MSLLDKMIDTIRDSRRTIRGPIFIKDFSQENEQLDDLLELSQKVTSDKKKIIDRDIMYLKMGIEGEKNVSFELKNSFIPMLCLHDIRLRDGEYVAQYDYIIITPQFIYVLETKMLNGDIEITPDGDFIRLFKNKEGRIYKKEGMYSPISQNERHLNILRNILVKNKLIKRMPIKSAVIIANPKSIIDKKKCPVSIKNNIYKYDQLSNLIKSQTTNEKDKRDLIEKYLYNISDFLLKNNEKITFDYYSKYSLTEDDFKKDSEEIISIEVNENTIRSDGDLYLKLKNYRLETSRKEGIKAYFIFTNEQLNQLIAVKPGTLYELHKISGFGEKRTEKYGKDIIEIIKEA